LLFSSGQEALNYLRKNNDPEKHFLILLDLNMPVLNGWEFLQLTEEDSMAANIYVVIVTSSINREDYIRSKDFKQVIGFFRKPLDTSCMEHLKEIEKLRSFFLPQEDSPNIQKHS
jgi:CheY-like chemotaxis protein